METSSHPGPAAPLILVLLCALGLTGCAGTDRPAGDGDADGRVVSDILPGDTGEDVADLLPETDIFDPAACDPRLLAEGQVRAKPVVCAGELPTGPNAIGRVGDLLIENSRVRFVIRAGAGHTFVGMDGGTLVDADIARSPGTPGEERLQEIIPLFSLNAANLESLEVTQDGRSGEAVVTAAGPAVGVPYLASLLPFLQVLDATISHEYVLAADSSTLWIRTRITWNGVPGGASVMPIDGFFASGSLEEFPVESALGGAAPIPVIVRHRPGISYGFLGAKGYEMTSLGAVALATGTPVEAPADGALVVERALIVGDGSVSSITAELGRIRDLPMGWVVGVVEPTGGVAPDELEVIATAMNGDLITRFRVRDEGQFNGVLPPGPAQLHAVCPGCDPGAPVNLDVQPGTAINGAVVPPVVGSGVRLRITEDGEPIPARVTAVPADGGPARTLLAWPPDQLFPLPPGGYRFIASRGFEYEIATLEDAALAPGATLPVALELTRSVLSPGAMSADFHVHSENSVDSFVPLPVRVRAIAAEGLEFVVATDHDFVTDYGPSIEADGLRPLLASAPGLEMSSVQAGHMNTWPVVPDPDASGNGSLAWFGLPPGAVVDALRKGHPERVVQVNHPRFQNESTFDLIQFDPADGQAHADPVKLGFPAGTDLTPPDFDAMEIYNGIGDEDLEETLQDWYALLNMGRTITATAGGDSHDLKAFPGNPRNILFLGQDDPLTLTVEDVNEALRARRVLVTTGPYVEAGLLDGAGDPSHPGELVSDAGGTPQLWVKVQAPTWMSVTELSIIRNGVEVLAQEIEDPGEPALRPVVRLDAVFPVQAEADAWFVVRVRGVVPTPQLTNHLPQAITNPLLLDVDGDGQFSPPGL
jgi:hypothetical protein